MLGDYKEVGGWYLPFSVESGVKGNPNRSKVTYEKIEANVALDDSRFAKPAAKPEPPTAPDASSTAPKKPEEAKPGEAKPPAKTEGAQASKPPQR